MSFRNSGPLDCKVYVGNLGNNGSKSELENVFGYYGSLKNVWVARNPPGFAFVEFDDTRDAEDAVRALDGRTICGVRARVEMSSGMSRRGGGNDRGGGDRGRGGGGRRWNDDYGDRRGGGGGYRGERSRSRSPRRNRRVSRSRSRSPRRRRDRSPRRSRSRSPDYRDQRRERSISPRRSPSVGRDGKSRSKSRSRSRSPEHNGRGRSADSNGSNY